MKDALDQPIDEGDYIFYPQRHNSTLWIVLARVIKIEDGRVTVDRMDLNHGDGEVKRSYTEKLHRAIRIEARVLPERWRRHFEGDLVWGDRHIERIRKKDV